MDWDEPTKQTSPAPVLGEVLERMSVDELRTRIEALRTEIARVEKEIDKRQAHQAQADQIFKS